MIYSCKRIDEKLGITIFLDSGILGQGIFANIEKIVSESELDIMLIFYCEEPLIGVKYGLKVSEIIQILKSVRKAAKNNVFCDIYSDLSFNKSKIKILNGMMPKRGSSFSWSITPVYSKGVDTNSFFENIQILSDLNILGEISCVVSQDNFDEDMAIFEKIKNSYPEVFPNPKHGEEDWFFEKFGEKPFYKTHTIHFENSSDTVNIQKIKSSYSFKGFICNKKNHITIKLSGPTYYCLTDLFEGLPGSSIYGDIPEICCSCEREKCLHEDNVSVYRI
mgnify:CR=1 FL=1